ncbi:hypothetical protein JHN59_37070 [Streptomyces sp. MBT49]|uniref:hypothetical protein n=1 Tax=unclassified Streptomyces TaxID=2593676 RepID=UPI001909F03D|nr:MULTISPECIES: hypothetical protein [unclassified Streptomyces]MBK3630313.1 hypothetical protein [Streptomyces sp. MBT49]MBK3634700.1 hypothetical protein [Streptomyces sp. MBT97]
MSTEDLTVLTAAVLAAAVAIVVPWLAFRYALRQEHARWLREQRATLYADLLVEALAEQEWCQYAMSSEEAQAIAPFEDMRLPRLERARLGARGTSLGSREVNRLFNEVGAVVGRLHMAYSLGQVDRDLAQTQLRVEGGRAFDRLEAAIRSELDADRPPARLSLRSSRPRPSGVPSDG